MAVAGSLLALLLFASATVPLGFFLPPLLLFGFFLPFWGVPWAFGVVHAFSAAKRGNERAKTSRPLWLFPGVLLVLVVLLAFTPVPRRLAFSLARPALERLLAEAEELESGEVLLDNRWLGIWPTEKIVRYASGEVKLEILGGRLFQETTRGLAFDPDGPPLPGSWQPDRTLDLGGNWYGWTRR